MEIAQPARMEAEPAQSPYFDGEVRFLAVPGASLVRLNEVRFAAGARTKWHTHSFEQILVITGGRGIVATAAGEREVVPGDVVICPAGERHWHGATATEGMTHLSLNGQGGTVWEMEDGS